MIYASLLENLSKELVFKLNALSHFEHNNYIKLWGFFKAFWPLWTILTINYTSASYSGYVHSHYFNVTQHSHSHSLRTYILTMILSSVLWLFYSSLIFILFLQFMYLWCTFWVLFHRWVGIDFSFGSHWSVTSNNSFCLCKYPIYPYSIMYAF